MGFRGYRPPEVLAMVQMEASHVVGIRQVERGKKPVWDLVFELDAVITSAHPGYRRFDPADGVPVGQVELEFPAARQVNWAWRAEQPSGYIDSIVHDDDGRRWALAGEWGRVELITRGNPRLNFGSPPQWYRGTQADPAPRFFGISPEAPATSGRYRDDPEHGGSTLHLDFVYSVRTPIITSLGTYAVTKPLGEALQASEMTGFRLLPTVTTVEDFVEDPGAVDIPELFGLQIVGEAFVDDFGHQLRGDLVVSERAIDLLRSLDPELTVYERDWSGQRIYRFRAQ